MSKCIYCRFLKETYGKQLYDLSLSNDLMGIIPKAYVTKAKMYIWDHIKLKCFYAAKETINRGKNATYRKGEIFANHVSNKELNI
jgi:hypothetical protein